jgi:hypothetical protein
MNTLPPFCILVHFGSGNLLKIVGCCLPCSLHNLADKIEFLTVSLSSSLQFGPEVQDKKECYTEDDQVDHVTTPALLKCFIETSHPPLQVCFGLLHEFLQGFCLTLLQPALFSNSIGHLHGTRGLSMSVLQLKADSKVSQSSADLRQDVPV